MERLALPAGDASWGDALRRPFAELAVPYVDAELKK